MTLCAISISEVHLLARLSTHGYPVLRLTRAEIQGRHKALATKKSEASWPAIKVHKYKTIKGHGHHQRHSPNHLSPFKGWLFLSIPSKTDRLASAWDATWICRMLKSINYLYGARTDHFVATGSYIRRVLTNGSIKFCWRRLFCASLHLVDILKVVSLLRLLVSRVHYWISCISLTSC